MDFTVSRLSKKTWVNLSQPEADEEMAPKYTFFRKYFEIGDEEIEIHKKKCFFVTSVKKKHYFTPK